ncbi:hypothetical protein C0V82_16250 [Niveispirillum cyanobacteriorum]|uniref:Uncharacterized protein n=2 Tax=Niveispirillum cyanobacteriorum TaxID=1612173 RepID=A0A2K9NFS0_9PROT|nr:hypothetical protein C0V82_16250 [Niveispirillum cyanobacteriorum]
MTSVDFGEAVAAAVASIQASGDIERIIREQMVKTIKSVVESSFASYGKFGEALKAEIAGSLRIGPGSLGLDGYNQMVLNVCRQVLHERLDKDGRAAIEDALTELLGEKPPAHIRLSDLAKQFGEWARDNAHLGNAAIELRPSQYGARWLTFGFNNKYGARSLVRDSCEESVARFAVHEDGRMYGLNVEGIDVSKAIFFGSGIRGFLRTLFQMQVAGTSVEIDTEAPEDFMLVEVDSDD